MTKTAKHEWRKQEKDLYLTKGPVIVDVKPFKAITISGKGNPNSPEFQECIQALYGIAYTIKMSLKKEHNDIDNYVDWTVYPLEGIWDICDEAKNTKDYVLNKDDLVFTLIIRQPDFINDHFFNEMKKKAIEKKKNPLMNDVEFKTIEDGLSVQMIHNGSFDNESETFELMEQFAIEQGYKRVSKIHREIYLSDFRKTPTEKLKTLLRFKVYK